jgi:hypothetical protein
VVLLAVLSVSPAAATAEFSNTTLINSFSNEAFMGIGVIMAIMWGSICFCSLWCICCRKRMERCRRGCCTDIEFDGFVEEYCYVVTSVQECFCDCDNCDCCDECAMSDEENGMSNERNGGEGCGCLGDDVEAMTERNVRSDNANAAEDGPLEVAPAALPPREPVPVDGHRLSRRERKRQRRLLNSAAVDQVQEVQNVGATHSAGEDDDSDD